MASPRAVPAKTLGARAMDVAFKAFTGTLFAATVVTGGWFAATSASAVGHYDRLAKEAEKRREEEARPTTSWPLPSLPSTVTSQARWTVAR